MTVQSYTTSGGVSCPKPMTRAALLALRNAGALKIGCHYTITDHVQGRLVAGTTITLHADSATELSMNVSVNTTYDNVGWFGVYDIDAGVVMELQDNRNNVVRGTGGTQVSNFDWGNAAYTNVRVDNATLTATIGATHPITSVTVSSNSTLNLTGFTGAMNQATIVSQASVNLTNANGTWRLSTWERGVQFNITDYSGGGDHYYNSYSLGVFNASNTTSALTIRNNRFVGATINLSGATAGNVSIQSNFISNGGYIVRNGSAGDLTVQSTRLQSAILTHTAGTVSITACEIANNCNIVADTDAAGSLTLAYVRIADGSILYNRAAGALTCTNSHFSQASNIQRVAGSTGAYSISNSTLTATAVIANATNTGNISMTGVRANSTAFGFSGGSNVTVNQGDYRGGSIITEVGCGGNMTLSGVETGASCTIRKFSSSTSGVLNLSGGVYVTGQSYLYHRGTGDLNVYRVTITNLSGLDISSGDRSYEISGGRIDSSSTFFGTATGGAALLERIRTFSVRAGGQIASSATGTVSNWLLSADVFGTNGRFEFQGGTQDVLVSRCAVHNGILRINNYTGGTTYHDFLSSADSSLLIQNIAVNKPCAYITVRNGGSFNLNGSTVAGGISRVDVRNGGTYFATTNAATANYVDVSQGQITHNGGDLNYATKTMLGGLTTGNFNQMRIAHHAPVSKTLTAINIDRADYLGLTSASPLV